MSPLAILGGTLPLHQEFTCTAPALSLRMNGVSGRIYFYAHFPVKKISTAPTFSLGMNVAS